MKVMAELDKNLVMNMLQNLLGDGEKSTLSSKPDIPQSAEPSLSIPTFPTQNDTDDVINTAAIMSQFTDMMGKFRQAGNTKEAALLSALKPYLRSSRQPKVDTMLRALQAFRMFSQMKKPNRK